VCILLPVVSGCAGAYKCVLSPTTEICRVCSSSCGRISFLGGTSDSDIFTEIGLGNYVWGLVQDSGNTRQNQNYTAPEMRHMTRMAKHFQMDPKTSEAIHRITGVLSFFHLPVSLGVGTRRFGNWIYFRLQVKGGRRHLLSWSS
jgi:hypothetical protein